MASLWLHANFAKDRHHGTPIRKSGLEQVQSYESGEEKPVRAYPVSQGKRSHDEGSCDQSQVAVYIHGETS
jgi:hypothetical protein